MNHDHHSPESCCSPNHSKKRHWFLNKNLLTAAALLAVIAISYLVPSMAPFRQNLQMYIRGIGWAILAGLLLGGLLDYAVPSSVVSSILARKQKRAIFYAVSFGLLMSACSHGILALAVELYKKGASTPVVVSFLLASPWANLPITLILLGFFGWKALYIILGALAIAVITGLIFQWLESKKLVESNPHTTTVVADYSILDAFKKRAAEFSFKPQALMRDTKAVLSASVRLADMTLWWILIGIGLSSLAATLIPNEFFHRFMGPTGLGLITTLGVATVMEVCSEGTAPMAFEIFRQTGAFGNAFVFLMAGVVTDITEIGLLWYNVGRRTALWLPIVTVPQVVLLGFIANHLFK